MCAVLSPPWLYKDVLRMHTWCLGSYAIGGVEGQDANMLTAGETRDGEGRRGELQFSSVKKEN